ncbi:MAG: hypothetical protein EBX09_07455 [Actinobacteria bacterium]|nr:hypothetical protein [Actinomycetota bacterium]NCX76852.1 hypothetical protein [Actinomycetota bacterium]
MPPQPIVADFPKTNLEVHDAILARDAVAEPFAKHVFNAFKRDAVGNYKVNEVRNLETVFVHVDDSTNDAVEITMREKLVHF